MNKVVLSVIAALAVSAAVPAFAADMPVKAVKAPEAASPWDLAFGAAVMNDYIFRGVTQSNHKASGAVYLEPRYNITKDIQLYIGTSFETIKFPNDATLETDFYGGVRPTFGPIALDLGVWYYGYPGGNCYNTAALGCSRNVFLANGNVIKGNMSFYEFYFKPTWNVNDSLAIGATLFYTPSMMNSGAPGTYVSGTVKYTAPANMAIKDIGWYLSGEFGRQYLGTTDSFYGVPGALNGIKYADYNTWNLGVGFTWKQATLDLRYSDTDLSKANCNAYTSDSGAPLSPAFVNGINGGVGALTAPGSNWCGAAFVAKLSVDFTASSFK
jgi:uncharacterized protein (TIGR02001 family)